MYVRRNQSPLTPPVNYAGVAFSKDRQAKQPGDNKDTKIHKAHTAPASDISAPFKVKDAEKKEEMPSDDILSAEDALVTNESTEPKEEECAPKEPKTYPNQESDTEKVEQKGLLSELLDGKFTTQDILLFASLFLLVSGQIDDEILLLAGVLLLLNH